MRRMVLTTTVILTAIAIGFVGYGIVRAMSVTDGTDALAAGLVAAVALLLVGVPAALMWSHALRVLRGNASAAWRVYDELRTVVGAMVGIGVPSTLFTGQIAAFGFLVGAFVTILVCKARLNRIIVRDRVRPPPPNWIERRFARSTPAARWRQSDQSRPLVDGGQ